MCAQPNGATYNNTEKGYAACSVDTACVDQFITMFHCNKVESNARCPGEICTAGNATLFHFDSALALN